MVLILNTTDFLKLKKKNKLTMTELAAKIGVSRPHLWRILKKQSNPGERFLAGFKRAFPEESLEKYFYTESVAE